MKEQHFDCFLSHNNKDRALVHELALRLHDEADIASWLDAWHIPTGSDWEKEIGRALDTCKVFAVFLGENGWSKYHLKESLAAIERQKVDPNYRIISILLPGAKDSDFAIGNELFTRLKLLLPGVEEFTFSELVNLFISKQRVDFRVPDGTDDDEAFQRLTTGISGQLPFPEGRVNASAIRRDALHWVEKVKKDKTILYRGTKLREAQKIVKEAPERLNEHAIQFLIASALDEKLSKRRQQNLVLTLGGIAICAIIATSLATLFGGQVGLARRGEQQAIATATVAQGKEQIANETAQAESTARTEAQATAISEANAKATAQTQVGIEANAKSTAQANEQQKVRISRANELANLSNGIDSRFPQLRLLLAIESMKATIDGEDPPVPSSEQSLRDALNKAHGIALGDYGNVVAFSSDDKWLAIGNENGIVNFYNTQLLDFPLEFRLDSGDSVKSIIFSLNNSWLVVKTESGFSLWKKKGTEISNLELVKSQSDVKQVEISQNSKWLVAINDSSLLVFNLEKINDEPIKIQYKDGRLEDVTINSNSKWIITATDNGRIGIWDIDKLQSTGTPNWTTVDTSPIYTVLTSTNGNWVISESDNDIKVWSLDQNGVLIFDFAIKPQNLKSGRNFNEIRLSGNFIIYKEYSDHLYVLDLSDKEKQPIMVTVTIGLVYGISPDGKWVVTTAGGSGWIGVTPDILTFRLDNYPQVTREAPIQGNEGFINAFSFSHSDHWLVTAGDSGIRIWDTWLWDTWSESAACNYDQFLNDGDSLQLTRCQDSTFDFIKKGPAPEFSSDGMWFGVTTGTKLKLWRTTHLPTITPDIILDHQDKVSSFAISSDGRFLVTGGLDKNVKLWELSEPSSQPLILRGHNDRITFIKFSPDNHWLLTAGEDNDAFLWDLTSADISIPMRIGEYYHSFFHPAQFSLDSHWLLLNGYNKNPILYDLTSGDVEKSQRILSNQTTSSYEVFVFSPDSQWLFNFGNEEKRLRLWQLGNNEISFTSIGINRLLSTQSFLLSRDGKFIITGDKDSYEVWSFSELVRNNFDNTEPQIDGRSDGTLPELISNDNRWLVFSDYSIVDLQTLNKSHMVPGPTHLLIGPRFSNDSQTIMIASDLKSFKWDINYLQLPPIELVGGPVSGQLYFSPNSKWYVIDPYGIVIEYFDEEALIARACLVAGRNLTKNEWQRFFLNEEYRVTCPQWSAEQ